MPINYKKYPNAWTRIRADILKRAENRCEGCGIENHTWGWRDGNGEFIVGADPSKACFTIVLTISHTNHDVNDNRPENLRALCQKCHLSHDRRDNLHRSFQKKYANTDNIL